MRFWGLVVSTWIGNLKLFVLNLPPIGLWMKMISPSAGIPVVVLLRVLRGKREEAFQN